MHRVPNRRKEEFHLFGSRTSRSPLPEPFDDVDTPFLNGAEPVQLPNDLPGTRGRREIVQFHPFINGASVIVDNIFVDSLIVKPTGLPCDSNGNFLPEGSPLSPS